MNKPSIQPAVVTIHAESEKTSISEIVTRVRMDKDVKTLGFVPSKVKRTRNGGILLELPKGPEANKQAIQLAKKIQEIAKNEVKVNCPQRPSEFVIRELDPSTTSMEISTVIAAELQCGPSEFQVSRVVANRGYLGMAWVRCSPPLIDKFAKLSTLRIGWTRAKVRLAKPKPTQCFRCLQYGHLRSNCISTVDRGTLCFRCGADGHFSNGCINTPWCLICPDEDSQHRMGSSKRSALKRALDREANRKSFRYLYRNGVGGTPFSQLHNGCVIFS